MKIKLVQKRHIKWACADNSDVNGRIEHTSEKIIIFHSDISYHRGDIIKIDDQSYIVKKIIYTPTKVKTSINDNYHVNKNYTEYIDAYIESEDMSKWISYYAYFKTFTHCMDCLKTENDPTKDLNHRYEFVPPLSFEEWVEDERLLDFVMYNKSLVDIGCVEITVDERIKLVDRRCKRVDG